MQDFNAVFPETCLIFTLMFRLFCRRFYLLMPLLIPYLFFAQETGKDSLFFMNGKIVISKVVDTTLNLVTAIDPKDSAKRINYEDEELLAIRFNRNQQLKYYYRQDTVIGNWFTRDEMWMFVKGERDARKGFKPYGSFYGGIATGLIGGLSGTFLGPLPPFTFTMLVGIPKVRIRHKTVSNPYYLDSDAYILGYEREARSKRRLQSLLGGAIGLVAGYVAYYGGLRKAYPESLGSGFNPFKK